MKSISKISINKALILVLCIYIAICAYIINYFKLNIPVSILLFLSGGGVIILINPFLKPLVKLKQKAYDKKQKKIDFHINIAKKSGKRSFAMGPDKKHTVWAVNIVEAAKLYNLHIKPKLIKHPNKSFWYISKLCNNTSK